MTYIHNVRLLATDYLGELIKAELSSDDALTGVSRILRTKLNHSKNNFSNVNFKLLLI